MIKYLLSFAMLVAAFAMPAQATTVFSPKITQSLKYLSHGLNVDTITSSSPSGYPEANLQQLSALGITNIRVPVLVGMIVAGTPLDSGGVTTQPVVDAAMAKLDGLVASFLNHGFSVTLCVFTTKGMQALPVQQSAPFLIQGNRMLAARYGPVSADRIFLEVLNEPHMDVNTWNTLAPQLVTAARQSAPGNTIIVDSAWNAIPTNLPFLNPISDSNVIYNMHVYQPSNLTTQGSLTPIDPLYLFPKPVGAVGPPGSEVAKEWTAQKLSSYVMAGITWSRQHKLPLTMNEFGISKYCDPQSEINWLSFMRQITDANSIPWAFWGYYHLFPTDLATQTPNYDPVVWQALGPNPLLLNFGISFKTGLAPFVLFD